MAQLGRVTDEPSWQLAGQAVRRARERLGLTQEELAARANVSRSTLQKVERGDSTISRNRVRRIAEALGLDLLRLLPEAGDEQELAAIRARLQGTGLSGPELDAAARAIQAERRNLPRSSSPGHDQAV